MTQANTAFERRPGQGYVFWKHNQPDARTKAEQKALAEKKPVPFVSVWRGWLALPGGISVQVRAIGSSRTRDYTVALHQFPEQLVGQDDPSQGDSANDAAWAKLAEFKLPAFGEMPYVDGSFTLNSRTYKIRAIKADDGFIRLRLPQVMDAKAAAQAMI